LRDGLLADGIFNFNSNATGLWPGGSRTFADMCPRAMINIAHVARNNVAADIIEVGNIRAMATYSAP
jgi:hypothetical protein